jgi:hypothetical protein
MAGIGELVHAGLLAGSLAGSLADPQPEYLAGILADYLARSMPVCLTCSLTGLLVFWFSDILLPRLTGSLVPRLTLR